MKRFKILREGLKKYVEEQEAKMNYPTQAEFTCSKLKVKKQKGCHLFTDFIGISIVHFKQINVN